jgi:hypothetical protein
MVYSGEPYAYPGINCIEQLITLIAVLGIMSKVSDKIVPRFYPPTPANPAPTIGDIQTFEHAHRIHQPFKLGNCEK